MMSATENNKNQQMNININKTVKMLAAKNIKAGINYPFSKSHALCIQKQQLATACEKLGLTPISL
jgi:hypothetical protein